MEQTRGRRSRQGRASPIPKRLSPGDVIDGHLVVRNVLGEGGTAIVYEAEHTRLGRTVAVKVLKPELATDTTALARLEREAKLGASIDSEHIPHVYDIGRLENGLPFLSMERLRGDTLERHVENGPLPIAAAVALGRQLLSALDAIHDKGAIHRDVKPSNVILHETADEELVLKLVDLGISRAAQADKSTSVTQTGIVLGTPRYMAPEQLQGRSLDGRVDLYGAGALLYQMLVGQAPFDGATVADVTAAILRDDAPLARKRRTDCPAQLEAVIARAMKRDPEGRFASAQEMNDALARIAKREGYPLRIGRRDLERGALGRTSNLRRVAAKACMVGAAVGVLAATLSLALDIAPTHAIAKATSLDGPTKIGVTLVTQIAPFEDASKAPPTVESDHRPVRRRVRSRSPRQSLSDWTLRAHALLAEWSRETREQSGHAMPGPGDPIPSNPYAVAGNPYENDAISSPTY